MSATMVAHSSLLLVHGDYLLLDYAIGAVALRPRKPCEQHVFDYLRTAIHTLFVVYSAFTYHARHFGK